MSASGPLDLSSVLDEVVDWRVKAYPLGCDPLPIRSIGAQRWRALDGDLLLPVMVLRDAALAHNIELMAGWCTAHSISLAPHAKTPLAPQIAQRQLAAGAWALTVADVHQARVLREVGASRLLIANELVEPAAITWLATELNGDPDLQVYCLVDSEPGAALLQENLSRAGLRRPLPVLIELGIPGGRCGCRTVQEAVQLAHTVSRMNDLNLAGVEAYENLFPPADLAQTIGQVSTLLEDLRELAGRLDAAGMFHHLPEIVVSAGGSMWFDQVAARLSGPWPLSRPVRTVVRAGSYVTHDAAAYEERSPLARRSGGGARLRQALELWATVLSRPEPDLVILGFGKRDAAHDRGLPIPFAARTANGSMTMVDDCEVLSLNDQHARLRVRAESTLRVGDLVGSYISHPCTSFDNWRVIPLVDDDYLVREFIRSYL